MYSFAMKLNQIWLKLVQNLYVFKLFSFYIIKENKWNEFKKTYTNNLLTLNLFFYFSSFFISFYFSSPFSFLPTFPLYFLYFTVSPKFPKTKHSLSFHSFLSPIPIPFEVSKHGIRSCLVHKNGEWRMRMNILFHSYILFSDSNSCVWIHIKI